MPSIEYYVQKIKDDDKHLTTVNLSKKDLTAEQFAPIQQAYADNPNAAARLTKLLLGQNKIVQLKIANFPNLKEINLSSNPLEKLQLENTPVVEKLYLSKTQVKLPQVTGLLNLKILSLIEVEAVTLDLSELPMLTNAEINGEKLSVASKIVIQTLTTQHPALRIMLNNLNATVNIRTLALPALTLEILHAHFSQVLAAMSQARVPLEVQHKIAVLYKAAKDKLPKELIGIILLWDTKDEIAEAFKKETNCFHKAFTPFYVGATRHSFEHNQKVTSAYFKTDDYKVLCTKAQLVLSSQIESLATKFRACKNLI